MKTTSALSFVATLLVATTQALPSAIQARDPPALGSWDVTNYAFSCRPYFCSYKLDIASTEPAVSASCEGRDSDVAPVPSACSDDSITTLMNIWDIPGGGFVNIYVVQTFTGADGAVYTVKGNQSVSASQSEIKPNFRIAQTEISAVL